MKNYISIITASLFLFFVSLSIEGASYERVERKLRLPEQFILEKTTHTNSVAADDDRILADHAGATSAVAVTVTSFLAQPDVARNIVVTPTGTTADVAAGSVVVTGRDIQGKVISESFVFTANQSTAVTGNKAFASITSIVFPAEDSPFGATWDVGVGTKLGLSACLDKAGFYLKGLVDGADLTGSTVAVSSTELASNTVIPNPAPDGSRDFDLLYFPNYSAACY